MTITVVKAGEAIVKTASKTAPATASKAAAAAVAATPYASKTTGGPATANAGIVGTIPLKEARAVTSHESPTIEPAKVSTTTTMMPWHNWFERWLKATMGAERVDAMNRMIKFQPDDVFDLHQQPKPNHAIPISKTDPTLTHMFRHPSPGSQAPVHVPRFEAEDDPFDSAYFKRDTRRRYMNEEIGNPELERTKLELMDPDDPMVQEEMEKLAAGRQSSPGNKGRFATGPTKFDPTGLRATMSATWSAYEESLDQHMPDHLPTPSWVGQEEQVIAKYESRGLPVPVGDYYAPLKVPRVRRLARW